jgi:hypothetical protein
MEGLTMSVQALEAANRKLDFLLAVLRPAPAPFSLRPEDMAAVLAEVLRVGEWLRGAPARPEAGPMTEELAQYRQHLEQLQQVLPSVHAQLLVERSRLEAERAHLETAAAWAAGRQSSR